MPCRTAVGSGRRRGGRSRQASIIDRRGASLASTRAMTIDLGHGELDLERARVLDDAGRMSVRLSTREVELVRYLYERRGRDVSRDELLEVVWGYAPTVLSRALDTTVARLRRKIERDASAPRQLLTVHGHGYRWAAPAEVSLPSPRSSVVLRLADREVDLERLVVIGDDGSKIALTAAEGRLLQVLAREPSRWVIPEELLPTRRGRPAAARMLKSAVHRLRKKLERDPRSPRVLVCARANGYRLEEARLVARGPEAPRFVWSVVRHVGGCLGLDDCVLYLRHRDKLAQVAAYGPKSPAEGTVVSPIELRVGEGIVGAAAATGSVQSVPDTRRDPRYIFDCYAGRSELAVPVVDRGRVVGVIDSESQRAGAYDEGLRRAFLSLADIVASGLRDTGWSADLAAPCDTIRDTR